MRHITENQGKVYDVGCVESIPLGEGRAVQVGRVPLAVFRTRQGEVFATQARCPHKAGPLADGLVGGRVLMCPLHEYNFDLATGKPLVPDCKPLKTYPVQVDENGRLLLRLEPREAAS